MARARSNSLPLLVAPALLLAPLVLLATALPAAAQAGLCGPPDGFGGPCCALAAPALPPFPAVAFQDAREVCFIDCGPAFQQPGTLTLTPPAAQPGAPCGIYSVQLGGSLATGALRLHYTRSWTEVGGGPPRRVFRFVVNGPVDPLPSPAPSCQVESSAAGLPSPFFYGFLDYNYECTGAAGLVFRSAAIAIGHTCDRFMHDGSCPFTSVPGAFHPFDSTVFVAPGSNFTPNGNLVPPAGAVPGLPNARSAVRELDPVLCTVNDPFTSASLANTTRQCSCIQPPIANFQPFTPQELKGATQCTATVGTSVFCPYNPPAPPALHTLYTWSIGSWGPGPYPGRPGGYRVWLTEGAVSVSDQTPCTSPLPQSIRAAVYGAETRWLLFPLANHRRVDLVTNVNPPTQAPLVGGQGDPTHVIFFY